MHTVCHPPCVKPHLNTRVESVLLDARRTKSELLLSIAKSCFKTKSFLFLMIKIPELIRKVERYRIQAAWCPPSSFKLGIILGTMSSAYVGPLDFMSGYWPGLSLLESIRYSTDDERQNTQKCRGDEGCYYTNLCSTSLYHTALMAYFMQKELRPHTLYIQ